MNRKGGETGKIYSNTEKSKEDLAFDNNMNILQPHIDKFIAVRVNHLYATHQTLKSNKSN
jgi:hypothetical protein